MVEVVFCNYETLCNVDSETVIVNSSARPTGHVSLHVAQNVYTWTMAKLEKPLVSLCTQETCIDGCFEKLVKKHVYGVCFATAGRSTVVRVLHKGGVV